MTHQKLIRIFLDWHSPMCWPSSCSSPSCGWSLTSFKPEQIALSMPPKFIFQPTLENYRIAIFESPYLEFLWNTVIITGFSTLLALLIGVPIAYSMAFYPTKRTDSSMLWMMSTRMLPPAGVIVPLYVIFQRLNLARHPFGHDHHLHRHEPAPGGLDGALVHAGAALCHR